MNQHPTDHRLNGHACRLDEINGHASNRWPEEEQDTVAVRSFKDIEPEEISWLWKGKIALGKLTALVSVPGLGKSMLTCDLAARVSSGAAMPDGGPGVQGEVVLANAEDDPADTLRPRLDAAGANVGKVWLLEGIRSPDTEGEKIFTLADVPALGRLLDQRPEVRLVVLDPIGSYLTGADSHRDNEVRALLAPLVKLAADHNVAVLLVMHRRKSMSRSADDMVLGSRAFTGVVRQTWHLTKDPADPRNRLMLPGKCNIAAAATGMSFTIVGDDQAARIAWNSGDLDMTADDAANAEIDGDGGAEESGALEFAKKFLREELADGPRKSKEIQAEAREADITVGTLRRAREEVCDKPYRDGFGKKGGWFWRLSEVEANYVELSRSKGVHKGAHDSPTHSACAPLEKPAHLWENDPENIHMKAVKEGGNPKDAHPLNVEHQCGEGGDQ